MRPVKSKDLDTLVRRNTILLLNINSWTAGYIRHTIARSPSHITTKKGNKSLPTEIWLMILSLLQYKMFRPVYAVEMSSIQVNDRKSEPAIVCNKIDKWWGFGDISDRCELVHYENYLISPLYDPEGKDKNGYEDDDEERPPKCPFFTFSKTILQDQCLTIPVSNLEFEKPFLYLGVKAPDMISRCEGGMCRLCDQGREFCAGCRDGRKVMENFTSLSRAGVDCGTRMMCPLCIGIECAEKSAYETSSDGWNDNKMSDEEYEEWVCQVMKRLGYM